MQESGMRVTQEHGHGMRGHGKRGHGMRKVPEVAA